MLRWGMAPRLPTSIVSTADTSSSWVQTGWSGGTSWNRMRIRAAKPAALGPTDMKAVTGVGAPSYTSGVHTWNGAAATLKLKPATTRPMPSASSSGRSATCVKALMKRSTAP